MKILINRLFFIMICFPLLSSPAFARLNYNAPRATVTPTFDGILSAGEWDDAVKIAMVYPDIVTPPKEGTFPSAHGSFRAGRCE